MKHYCFTVDDNIRFFKELTQGDYASLFDHPYPALLRRLHEKFGIRIQLNLFYRVGDFDLSMASDAYQSEWQQNADWLKLSFHSECENVRPYETSPYNEVFADCQAVHREIMRFAGKASLAKTTTVHYCQTLPEGVEALRNNGVQGLLGLFGTPARPITSYSLDAEAADLIRSGATVRLDGMAYAALDMIVNSYKYEKIAETLAPLVSRETLHIMIHEQYFYQDYKAYQPDFEEKLTLVFTILHNNGFQNAFFEDMI